jgi:hypothetical protein
MKAGSSGSIASTTLPAHGCLTPPEIEYGVRCKTAGLYFTATAIADRVEQNQKALVRKGIPSEVKPTSIVLD